MPVVLGSLNIGSAIAVYQERIASERLQQLRKLAYTFIFEVHDEIVQVQGSTKARELVIRTGLEYLDALSANAGKSRSLQAE